jgi:hypothetical protein
MNASMPGPEKPIDLGGVPAGEDINATDAARRTEHDPGEQPNATEREHAEDPLTLDEDTDD